MNQESSISQSQVTEWWSQVTEWLSDPLIGGVAGCLAVVYVVGFVSIFARAGFHWGLGLLMAIPGLNVVLFAVLSFSSWPNRRELKGLRKVTSAMHSVDTRHRHAA